MGRGTEFVVGDSWVFVAVLVVEMFNGIFDEIFVVNEVKVVKGVTRLG